MIERITKVIISFLAISALITTGCATTTTNVRQHSTLESQLIDVDSVLVVTPAVTIEKINFSDQNERMTELENDLKQQLITLANEKLTEKGFEVVKFDIEKAIEEDEQLAYAVTQAREGFQEAKKTLYDSSLTQQQMQNFKVSVGTAVNIVSEKSGADAVLLLHYSGQRKSGGSVAKDIAVGVLVGLLTGYAPVSSFEASIVEAAFIDGVTGDVLWSNIYNSQALNIQPAKLLMDSFPQDIDSITQAAPGVKKEGATVNVTGEDIEQTAL